MSQLRNLVRAVIFVLITPPVALPQVEGNPVSVGGLVLTEGQNQRIENVAVRLCDSSGNLIEQTSTSDTAEFSFRGLQRASYIVTFEADGFEKTEIRVDLSFASNRGMTVYMKPSVKRPGPVAVGATVSVHELSMPQAARDLVASGKRKLYADHNSEGGLRDFQQAAATAPGYYEVYCQIAIAYVTLGRADQAENSFRKSIEVSHDSYGDAEVGLGTLLIEKGDVDAGERAVRRGVELNPSSWMGFYELGKLDLSRGHLDSALISAERARVLAPNTPIIYRLLSNVHVRQENYAALLDDIDAYLKLDPNSPAGVRAAQLREQVAKRVASQGQAAPAGSNPR